MIPDYETSRKAFEDYGLECSEELYGKLCIYADFLVKSNRSVNLTAITEPTEILYKHFIDSIIICGHIPENAKLIDVGTGAGFPSVPLKLYRPDISITLLDSLNKRIEFLKQLCERLGVEAEFIHERAENLGKDSKYREQFDVSCARAVANMSLLSELCIPFVKEGGIFVAMKGPTEDISLGARAVETLGGEIRDEYSYNVADERRKLVIIKKISHTSTKYPRNSSQIKKKNL